MLLRFRVSNHLSFRDLQEVSFVASSLKEREGYLIACAVAPNNSVVPAAVVYGAMLRARAISSMRCRPCAPWC